MIHWLKKNWWWLSLLYLLYTMFQIKQIATEFAVGFSNGFLNVLTFGLYSSVAGNGGN